MGDESSFSRSGGHAVAGSLIFLVARMFQISVILCSHNPRENYLRRVLESLRSQTLPKEQWELLLVDNASEKSLPERFDLSWQPNSRHVREEELGLTPARLRGIRESQADLLVFVDDDTVLAADYLEQTLAVGRQWPFIGAWCGSAAPEYEKPLPGWVGDQAWRLTVVEVKEDVWSNLRDSLATIPYGAGMCVRRNVCLCYLGRCEDNQNNKLLGRKGTGLSGYEEVELAHCAIDLGLGTGKSTRLRLTHLIPASRLTLDYFVRHAEGDAASFIMFRAIRGLPIQKPRPPTWISSLRWFFHRLIHRVSREQYEIQKAHRRGLERGYQQAQNYLQAKPAGWD
jgi:glycosyltransferase involved in cell wall biosynthesis